MANRFPNETDDQLKAMWVQTQRLRHRATVQRKRLLEELGRLEDHSSDMEVELIRRGYMVTRAL